MRVARKALLYLLLCLVGLSTVFPFLWMVSTSFKTMNEVFSIRPNFIPRNLFTDKMWDNYQTILVKHNFLRYVQNSLFVATTAAFGQLVACSLSGFAFARMKFAGKEILFGMLLATLMIPVEVTIIPEYLIMLKLGWYNTFLPLIVPSMLVGSFGTFLFRSFFENIPTTLEDAAFIDGVNSWQMFYKIFLPNAKPAIASLFIIAFMNNWNDLLRPVIYLDSEHLWTATMGLMQFKGNYGTQWHLLLTGSVISVIPLIAVYIAMQRYFVEGMLGSGMKG
ncbi:MAG: sugar ABC transporter permease [Peptococcaceae bacterium 1109]|jgi:multiple sugar transport system permease protein|nr:MAG: sugar ABC transporter permease [Peptococcaceae bacterium 1109]